MTQKLSNNQVEALEKERQLYKTVFENQSGRELLEKLEYAAYINRTTFDPNNKDSILINEGKRFIVLHIKNMLNDNRMEAIKQKIKESNNART